MRNTLGVGGIGIDIARAISKRLVRRSRSRSSQTAFECREIIRKVPLGGVVHKAVNITKHFPGVLANDHICLELRKGEIHAILGENGAGKSTFASILYGLYRPDEGSIFIGDKEVFFDSPRDAISHGVGMVHQNFMLVPTFSVVENVALGLPSSRRFLLDNSRVKESIERLSSTYGLVVNPDAKIWQLSVGERQKVEIVKALYRGASILILDEPTAVLTPQESRDLFEALKSMNAAGNTIILITHKLDEALAASDRITVLRSGKVVSTVDAAETSKKQISRLMVGREVAFASKERSNTPRPVALRVRNLCARSDKLTPALKEISFEICQGEILGIAGVAGNGQDELAQVLYGLRRADSGTIEFDGKDMTNKNPRYIIDGGIGYIPGDMSTGLFMDFSVAENMILHNYCKPPISRRSYVKKSEIDRFGRDLVEGFNIKVGSLEMPARVLSGGNRQKLVLAREFSRKLKVLIAANPTRGLDIGASQEIRSRLIKQAEAGTAILLISEDLDELIELSDNIAVIFEGRIVGVVSKPKIDIEELGLMMTSKRARSEYG